MKKPIEKAGIIGLGAVGAVLAVEILQRSPDTLVIIADDGRKKRIQTQGLNFNGRNFTVPVAEKPEPLDLIIIATKYPGFSEAMETIAPFVGPDTLILSLLNGISTEELLSERFGRERVLYSFFLGHTATRAGNRITHDGTYDVWFGEKENTTASERVERVKSYFERNGIPFRVPEDMEQAIWQKFVLNLGCNQATALLRCTFRHIQRHDQARALTSRLMEEGIAVARKSNVNRTEEMLGQALRIIDFLGPDDKSSMLQDVEAGRETEAELFAGALVSRARQAGVSVPLNEAVLEIFRALPTR